MVVLGESADLLFTSNATNFIGPFAYKQLDRLKANKLPRLSPLCPGGDDRWEEDGRRNLYLKQSHKAYQLNKCRAPKMSRRQRCSPMRFASLRFAVQLLGILHTLGPTRTKCSHEIKIQFDLARCTHGNKELTSGRVHRHELIPLWHRFGKKEFDNQIERNRIRPANVDASARQYAWFELIVHR